ncbi:MAG: hypothetical protein ACNA7X_03085 [Dehalococcoidia bacterium]
MRKAAGIIMLVFGVFTVVGGLIILRPGLGGMAQVWVGLALSVLIITGGISALRRKPYLWALVGAISMLVVATTSAVWGWQDPFYQCYSDTPNRLLMAVRSWVIWGGLPGLLALIFVVKRKDEFGASPDA